MTEVNLFENHENDEGSDFDEEYEIEYEGSFDLDLEDWDELGDIDDYEFVEDEVL